MNRLRSLRDYNKFVILPDDNFKSRWDIIIVALLLFTAIATPYRIAFFDVDELGWLIADSIVDFIFFIDIILNFFMAFYNSDEEVVDDRK